MKKIFLKRIKEVIIAMFAISLFACNQPKVDNNSNQLDSLQVLIQQRDSTLDELLASFSSVEHNLDSVALMQNLIYSNVGKTGEVQMSDKDRINAQIAGINDLMNSNRAEIARLTKKLKTSGQKNAHLEKTISILTEQLAQKDAELAALNQKLSESHAQIAQLQTSVETLSAQNNALSQNLNETTEALHTAYYVIGKSKDLEKAKLIDSHGGFIGIGKTQKMNADFDNSKFTKVDYEQFNSLPINSKNVKILSSHPSDSYSLDKAPDNKNMVTNLRITNPEKFWSSSKYLVIVID